MKATVTFLKAALTDEISSRELCMKGIDHRYFYEGYTSKVDMGK